MSALRELYAEINLAGNAHKEIVTLNKEMNAASDGIVKVQEETNEAGKAHVEAAEAAQGWGGTLKALAGLAIVGSITAFASASLEAASILEEQQNRLSTLTGKALPEYQAAIDKSIGSLKGLHAEGDMTEAVNQALKFGASQEVIMKGLTGLTQLADTTGTEMRDLMQQTAEFTTRGNMGLLEQNALFSKYAEEAAAIGTGLDEATKAKREMLVLNVLQEEANHLQEEHNKFLNSTKGLMQTYDTQMGNLQEAVGGFISKGIKPLLQLVNPMIEWLTSTEEGMATLETILWVVAPIIGVVMVAAIGAMISAAWASIAPILTFGGALSLATWQISLIVLGILFLILIIEDVYHLFTGGESVIGEFFQPFFDWIKAIPQWFKDMWNKIVQWFNDAIDWVVNFLKEWGPVIISYIFPLAALYFYWDEIVAFFTNAFTAVADWLKGLWQSIVNSIMSIWESVSGIFDSVMSFFGSDSEKTVSVVTQGEDGGIQGRRAAGGPVRAGYTYMVGEQGPEMFTPNTGGSITANSGFGGNKSFSLNIGEIKVMVSDANATKDAIVAKVKEALDELSKMEIRAELGMSAA